MKGLKKISVFGLLAVLSLTPTITKAEKVCTVHDNYYLFALIDHAPSFVNTVYSATNHTQTFYHGANFPMLPKNAEVLDNQIGITRGRVCMKRTAAGEVDSATECHYGTWTLEDYYNLLEEASRAEAKYEEFTVSGSSTSKRTKYYEKKGTKDGKTLVTKYYYGTEWFKCDSDKCANPTAGGNGVDTSAVAVRDLVLGSYLPSQTSINFDPSESNRAIITRKIDASEDFLDYVNDDGTINASSTNFKPFSVSWSSGSAAEASVMAPAVYFVSYQTCAYSATINYYYYKDGEATTDKVKLDDGTVKEPYHRDNIENGTGPVEVPSPSIKHCVIVDEDGEKNDADKVVKYTINNGDFNHNVYYRCDAYDATIYYYYYEGGKATDKKVDFGKDVDNPYTESGFLPGETKPVPSPEKKGCTIVDKDTGKKKDADKKVTISIDKDNPEDFEYKVYYLCPVQEEAKDSPKTGDVLIYLAWAIGLGAIGYSVYYFKKLKKEEV